MKLPIPTLLFAVVWVCGCATKSAPAFQPSTSSATGVPADKVSPPPNKIKAEDQLIVTPEPILTGRVAVFNEAGRFVVLDFPIGHLPTSDQVMFVFRQGLKVGEVKVTGPQRDHNTVADLLSGEARKGDEVRDR
jgi:hypothetical protein